MNLPRVEAEDGIHEAKMSTHGNIPGTSESGPTDGTAPPSSGLLKENLAVQLREAILSGKLAPGEKIIERRSARVLRLTDSAIIHTYQVRGALEGLAARIIVEQKLPIADLEAALVELRRAVEGNDVRHVIDRVQRFHVCILEKPGNPFLLENGLRLIVPLYAFTLM